MPKHGKLLSQRHPALYFLAVWSTRIKRQAEWHFDNYNYSSEKRFEKITFQNQKTS